MSGGNAPKTLKGPEKVNYGSAVAGALGNAISRTCIAPLERMRMQMIADPGKYRNMVVCITDIAKQEGIRGLWRGNTINVGRIAPQSGIGFFTKDYLKSKLGPNPTPIGLAGTSCVSAIVLMTTTYPLDLARTRITTTPGLYKGFVDCISTIWRTEGPLALFKGLNAANAFAVPYYGFQFWVYDGLRHIYQTRGMPDGERRPLAGWVAPSLGSVAVCSACVVAFPFQTAWKRQQVQGTGGRPIKYTGLFNVWKTVMKEEGIKGIYAGCPANVVKLAPTGAITFFCVEQIKNMINKE